MIRRKFLFAMFVVPALLGTLLHAHYEARAKNVDSALNDITTVKVSARRRGQSTFFYVENKECGEVTMTFDFRLVNLRSDVVFPYTATFAPGEGAAFTL